MLYSHGCATLCGFVIKMSAMLRVVVYTTLSRALVYKEYTVPASAILAVWLLVQRM